MNNEYYTTIGMDVSDRTTKVCVMAKAGGARQIVEETTIPTRVCHFDLAKRRFQPMAMRV